MHRRRWLTNLAMMGYIYGVKMDFESTRIFEVAKSFLATFFN